MGRYTQANRPLAIETPLGPDVLLLIKIAGSEAVSSLFHFQLEMLAEGAIDFGQLLGQDVQVRLKLPNGTERLIHGVISQLTQGQRFQAGGVTFIRYEAELVPPMWLLTQRFQSRVFQHVTVPDLLQRILHDEWKLAVARRLTGTYPERNFCVQYQETDYAFVSRLMEEEGIACWFLDTADGIQVVLADDAASYEALPKPIVYDESEGGFRSEPRVLDWKKAQELRPVRHIVRDYSFQMPQSNLQAERGVIATVSAGQVEHRLNLQRSEGPDMLKTLDYSASFAHDFEGIGRNGQDQKQQLQGLFQERERIARLRMEETAAGTLKASGRVDGCHFAAGRRFTLRNHFDADGSYLLTRVEMSASLSGTYVTDGPGELLYENRFECLPAALPYRPARRTPRPRIDSVQTAVVVGPAGQEIWVDPYGRVKVRFRWDSNQDSPGDDSCWIRVAQVWAGNGWGAFFWPRIGHEVVVAFEEGDPDRPLIVGSVYNQANMPPVKLPDEQTLAGFHSCIFGGDPATQFNAMIFHDTTGIEYVQVHSNKNEVNHSNMTRISGVAGRQYRFVGLFGD